MFSWLLGKSKQQTEVLDIIEKLNETVEMLEKEQKVFRKKYDAEMEKVKDITRAKNMRAHKQCLKRKRIYEEQIEQFENYRLEIHEQIIMLKGAEVRTKVVDALRIGDSTLEAVQNATNFDDVVKLMDEHKKIMKKMDEALFTCLFQPATAAPVAPVHVPADILLPTGPPRKIARKERVLSGIAIKKEE